MGIKSPLGLALKFVFFMSAAYYAVPFFFKICIGLYDNFFLTSISFNLDTLFINWNTTFPAVTVCEIYNGEKLWDITDEYFGGEHSSLIDGFVGEVVYFRGTCSTCVRCEEEVQCPKNFTNLMEMFRSKCTELLANCSYTNRNFTCCDEFLPIKTEYGICFAFNSNQARKIAQVQYSNNRFTGPGALKFDAFADIQLHLHPPIEIPFLFSEGVIRETLLLGSNKEIVVNVMEVFNHASVDRMSLENRRCRFSHERTKWGLALNIYEFYSFSTCLVECTMALHLEQCNCSSHILTSALKPTSIKIPTCDHYGLKCLSGYYQEMQQDRKSCDCMSSCEEPEYNIVYNSADDDHESENTHVKVSLVELPTQRYVRRVTKNHLDLIISVGGIVGLFFNASLIRVVEVIFLLIEYNWHSLWNRIRNCQFN